MPRTFRSQCIFLRVDCRQRCDVAANADTVLGAGILTWVARNVLGAFNDRMHAAAVGHTGETLDLFLCHKAMFQQVLRDFHTLFGLGDLLATHSRCKHSLPQTSQRSLLLGSLFFAGLL